MKKHILSLIVIVFTQYQLTAQVAKNNWIVSGGVNYTSANYSNLIDNSQIHNSNLTLSPAVGYFFVSKLAGGIRLQYADSRNKIQNFGGGMASVNRTVDFIAGPFLRYYLFNETNRVLNFVIEVNYGIGSKKTYTSFLQKYAARQFGFVAGPVVYFTSSVGLELTAGYYNHHTDINNITTKGMQIGIAFQVYFGRGDD